LTVIDSAAKSQPEGSRIAGVAVSVIFIALTLPLAVYNDYSQFIAPLLWRHAAARCILEVDRLRVLRKIGNMDLPTCPACKQSVLDDDAVECPFCGAPMKGGPAPSGPSGGPKSTAVRPPTAKPAPARSGPAPAAKAAPAAATSAATAEKEAAPAENDDPFAVDQSATANAIPVGRQQAPGKTLEVTCPMCETHGFVSPKAAGKLVKCCNPQCMVPVFTAPVIKKEVPVAPPPPPKKKLPWLYIAGGIAAAGIAAVCIYVMNQTGPTDIPPIVNSASGAKPPAAGGDADGGENARNHVAAIDGKQPPAIGGNPEDAGQRIVEDALERLAEMARKVPREHKSLYRRLAATAFIAAGDPEKADVHLDLLEKRDSASPYEAVLPRAALAWRKEPESPDEFRQEVGRIERLAAKLPKRGRFATEAALVAAPLLVVTGKTDQAGQLLADHRSDPGIEKVAAAMQVVIDDQTFNLDTTLPGRTVGDWQAPMDVAVVLILIHHGHWDEAFQWTSRSEDPVTRAELTVLWAESYLRRAVPADDAAGFERAKNAAEGLPAEGAARLLARLAAVKLAAGDRTEAEHLMSQSLKALNSKPPEKSMHVEGAKPLLDLKLPDPIPYVQTALAATEIAGVQMQLGESDAAWRNILLSLRMVHSIAPSTSWRDERTMQLAKEPKQIGDELSRAMALKIDADRRQAFNRYKAKLEDVSRATAVRYFWQGTVLEAAAEFGMLDQVWDELQVLDHKPSIHEREPLLSTALPLLVAARYAAAGNHKKAAEIRKVVEKRTIDNDAQVVKQISEDLFQAGRYGDCIQRLDSAMNSSGVLHEWALRLALRLVAANKIPEAVAFCTGIGDRDPALGVDGFFLTAALAARTGRAPAFWKEVDRIRVMEGAAVCAGLVVGLKSLPEEDVGAAGQRGEERR
jgi:hypothetical protein